MLKTHRIGKTVFTLLYAVLQSTLAYGLDGLTLSIRSVQSQALCSQEFSWMDNSLSQSPCNVAGYLLAQCANGNWIVPSIQNNTNHYTAPNATTANECQCSWAVYNLMEACGYCQGDPDGDFESTIQTWDSWDASCSNFSSSPAPYPPNVEIPSETAIPAWALTDPTTWQDSKFSPPAAEAFASQHKPDLTQSNRQSSKKSTPVGAIAGGVIGGVVCIAGLGILALCYIRRTRPSYRPIRLRTPRSIQSFVPQFHRRSQSDQSHQKFYASYTTTPLSGSTTTNNGLVRPPFRSILTNGSSSSSPMQSVTMQATTPDYSSIQYSQVGMMRTTPIPAEPMSPPMSSINASPFSIPRDAQVVSHAHNLSSTSNMSTVPSHTRTISHDPSASHEGSFPEGAISPYVLPPVITDSQERLQEPNTPPAVDSMPARRPLERKNPPTYASVTLPDQATIQSGAALRHGRQSSTETQMAVSGNLSGTTLLQASSSQEPTVLGVQLSRIGTPISEIDEYPDDEKGQRRPRQKS